MNKTKLNKYRGQKSTISRVYNKRIADALAKGDSASATSLRGAKTVKLRQIDRQFDYA